MVFADHRDAGCRLAAELLLRQHAHPVVLALPRCRVPVGFEVARSLSLGAPLDALLVRKIGAPEPARAGSRRGGGRSRAADRHGRGAGALGGAAGGICGAGDRAAASRGERWRQLYAGARRRYPLLAAPIVVDDGIATGRTARAALRAVRRLDPRRLVLAVPVASENVLEVLVREADEVVAVSRLLRWHAVSAHYKDFTQTSVEEVIRLLDEAVNPGCSTRPA